MLYRSVYESLDRPLCVKNNWCLIGTFTLIWLTAQKWEVIYCYISCEVIPHCSLYKNLRQIWERKRKSLHSFVSCILNIRIIPRGKSSAFLHLTGQTISDQKNLTMLDMWTCVIQMHCTYNLSLSNKTLYRDMQTFYITNYTTTQEVGSAQMLWFWFEAREACDSPDTRRIKWGVYGFFFLKKEERFGNERCSDVSNVF